jgi:hypothetical protein
LGSNWRKKLLGATSDGTSNMTGCYSGWKSRLANSCAGRGPLYRIHCSSHRVNLVNGRAIAALRETGSGWLDTLYRVVKLLRKQGNLIERMGAQSPYHVEVRWSSLSQVLEHIRKAPVLQEFYMTSNADEFVSIADAPEWWLLLAVLSEHFKMVKEALASLQGSVYFLGQNNLRIKTLRVELCELNGVKVPSACEQDASLVCNDPDVSITTAGSGVERLW